MSEHHDTSSVTELSENQAPRHGAVRIDPAHPISAQKSYLVIPARLASTRLPRKLLLRETGKSLIQHTYEAARRAWRPSGICVATDHEEIFREVRSFGGKAVMTDPKAPSGTDRVAEVARELIGVDIIVNVQGDEPELAGESIDLVIKLLEDVPAAVMATLATPIRNRRQWEDTACVKVVFDSHGRAYILAGVRSLTHGSGMRHCFL